MIRALRFIAESVQFVVQGRDPRWRKARQQFLDVHSKCAACGGTKDLNVHHIKPVHVRSDLELDPLNMITLCEHNRCHFIFGHLNTSWLTWNTHVKEDAKLWRDRLRNAPAA